MSDFTSANFVYPVVTTPFVSINRQLQRIRDRDSEKPKRLFCVWLVRRRPKQEETKWLEVASQLSNVFWFQYVTQQGPSNDWIPLRTKTLTNF